MSPEHLLRLHVVVARLAMGGAPWDDARGLARDLATSAVSPDESSSLAVVLRSSNEDDVAVLHQMADAFGLPVPDAAGLARRDPRIVDPETGARRWLSTPMDLASAEHDLLTPAGRARVLAVIDPDHPSPHHDLLRRLLPLEAEWREGDMVGALSDEYENVYRCAYLLFLIGDPADALALYRVKFETGDQDLGLGSYAQSIFGAGIETTLAHLRDHGHADVAAHLEAWAGDEDPDWIDRYRTATREYYYGSA